MTGKIKISQLPTTGGLDYNDYIMSIKPLGNNDFQNYKILAGNILIASSSYSYYASSSNFYGLINTPTLISSSTQFSSSDNPIFGNITASNIYVSGGVVSSYAGFTNSNVVSTASITYLNVVENSVINNNLSVNNLTNTNYLNTNFGTILSGSNIIGDKNNTTQSLNGNVIFANNAIIDGNLHIIGSLIGNPSTSSIIIDSSNKYIVRITVTSSFILIPPINGQDGQKLDLWITSLSPTTMSISGIKLPSSSTFSSNLPMSSSKKYIASLVYDAINNSGEWELTNFIGGY